MFRALLLDLDDTLFDRALAFERWALASLSNLDTPTFEALRVADGRGREPRARVAAFLVAHFPEMNGRSIEDVAAEFPASLASFVEPEAGTRAALEDLRREHHLVVVSNGGPAQREKLARAGVSELVDEVFVSAEVGIAKPELGIFERAMAWTGAEPHECLFVGDDVQRDIIPATTLGMKTAFLKRTAEDAMATYTIHSIAELRRICA